jgi:hypothetical protein
VQKNNNPKTKYRIMRRRTEMKKGLSISMMRVAALGAALFVTTATATAADETAKKKPLQIVFMFGQSEMVGQAKVSAASYMLLKPLVPPREVTLNAHKAMLHQINGAYLYWQAMHSYAGPKEKKQQLKLLIEERRNFGMKFRQQVLDEMAKNGSFRGKKYRRGFALFNLVDMETEAVGLTPKIRAMLDAPYKKFNHVTAYDQLIVDSNSRHEQQLALNKQFLHGTTPEDFARFAKEEKSHLTRVTAADTSPEDRRAAYATFVEKHLHMPIAKRTYISSLGSVVGKPESDTDNLTHGKLSVGYGLDINTFGLEYAAGITLENTIDAPILIVKCAWNDGRTSIAQPDWMQQKIQPHVKAILADPGKYHPGYDAKAGYDIAGMIWFQGLSDSKNPEYGKHLGAMLQDFRAFVKTPAMPVVCASVGTMMFQGESDDSLVNQGMREVANDPAFKGTIDVVETYKSYPAELAAISSLFFKRKLNSGSPASKKFQSVISNATGIKGKRSPPYLGSASFYLLAGNEVATSLAKMINGKTPVVPIR